MTACALIAMQGSKLIVVSGKHPVEAALIAIILGILVRNTTGCSKSLMPGIKAFEKPLVVGIVLIGATLNYKNLLSQGLSILSVVLITMLVGFVLLLILARFFKLSEKLGLLLAVGTTICGGTAIAVTAPLIKAKEEETSYAIATIALCGLLALILYPIIGRILTIDEFQFGIFAGTAIHSTPQVVGAGFSYSDLAGNTATTVKLVRNCFLAPVALLVALWYSHKSVKQDSNANLKNVLKAFPWFLFGFFIMSWLNTSGYFSTEAVAIFKNSGKFFILIGMAGIGLNTQFRTLFDVGLKPFILGLLGSLIVAGVSAVLICNMQF